MDDKTLELMYEASLMIGNTEILAQCMQDELDGKKKEQRQIPKPSTYQTIKSFDGSVKEVKLQGVGKEWQMNK